MMFKGVTSTFNKQGIVQYYEYISVILQQQKFKLGISFCEYLLSNL